MRSELGKLTLDKVFRVKINIFPALDEIKFYFKQCSAKFSTIQAAVAAANQAGTAADPEEKIPTGNSLEIKMIFKTKKILVKMIS